MKCNVANGFCPEYGNFGGEFLKCGLTHTKMGKAQHFFVKTCQHRRRMNRLEKAYKKDDYENHLFNDHIYHQWVKEKKWNG